MCGRINVSDNEGVRFLLSMLGMETWPSREPRFNIAPTQTLDVVQWQNQQATLSSMRWGLLPAWAKPGQFSAPLINARSETIRTKPSFRQLIATQRVLVPINGFYEWRREGKIKTPFHVYPKDHAAMFLGGVYQQASDKKNEDGKDKKSEVAIVTTAANSMFEKIHHRLPVILPMDKALSWIDNDDADTIDALMQAASNDTLSLKQVSSYVNSSRNQGPACLEAEPIDDLFGEA
ncbi:MAG: SOS response-associated peptidase [Granulosicoccaceae bacterium]